MSKCKHNTYAQIRHILSSDEHNKNAKPRVGYLVCGLCLTLNHKSQVIAQLA